MAIGLALWLLWWCVDVYRWRRVSRWPSTMGEVVSARTIISKADGHVHRKRIPTVEYEVEGQAYRAEGRYAVSFLHSGVLKRPLPTRRGPVEVFYDPDDVSNAVLDREVNIRFWLVPVVLMFFIWFFLAILG